MTIPRIAVALLLASSASILLAQRPAPQPNPAQPPPSEPLVADVHTSPYRPSINYTVTAGHRRVDIRNATLVNLIDYAHGIEDDDGREDASIEGGPSWLDLDRFDVAALVPSLQPAIPDTGPGGPCLPPSTESGAPHLASEMWDSRHEF